MESCQTEIIYLGMERMGNIGKKNEEKGVRKKLSIMLYANISEDPIHLIIPMKKTTLYSDGNPWEKTTSAFDVTMGSYMRIVRT